MTDTEMASGLQDALQRRYPSEQWKVVPLSALTKDDPRFTQGAFEIILSRGARRGAEIVSSHMLQSLDDIDRTARVIGTYLTYRMDNFVIQQRREFDRAFEQAPGVTKEPDGTYTVRLDNTEHNLL